MCAGGELPEWRAPEHELMPPELQQIGQVRGTLRKLENFEGSADTGQHFGKAGREPSFEPSPIEIFTGTDGSDLGPNLFGHVSASQIFREMGRPLRWPWRGSCYVKPEERTRLVPAGNSHATRDHQRARRT